MELSTLIGFHGSKKRMRFTDKRLGYTLLETTLVILVFAILFSISCAGGTAVIRKARISRAKTDLQDFGLVAEATINESPQIAYIASSTNKENLAKIMDSINKKLSAGYRLTIVDGTIDGKINKEAPTGDDSNYIVCESKRKDPWGNPYYVILDRAERGGEKSEFYVTAISAGPNALLNLDGEIDRDDLFNLTSFVKGKVVSKIYNMTEAAPTISDGTTAATDYVSSPVAPVNGTPTPVTPIGGGGGGGGGGGSVSSSYLTFSSSNNFSLSTANNSKNWDGILEWNDGVKDWAVWNGTSPIPTTTGTINLRGIGNTVITGVDSSDKRWVLTGSNISCSGNIESLLDYAKVDIGEHPAMADYCYRSLFHACTSLTSAPELPATTLASSCYNSMFTFCTSLTSAPALPATTLADSCYRWMFYACTSLTSAPALPATTLADSCYQQMFRECTSLVSAPVVLPATTLADYCYQEMFCDCSFLASAPALPATTLADYCYKSMFFGCTSLTSVPALPATTLAPYCYCDMFSGCSSLKLSTTQTGEYQYAYRIPTVGTGTTATWALVDMFRDTGGTFTGNPTINTTYYTNHPVS